MRPVSNWPVISWTLDKGPSGFLRKNPFPQAIGNLHGNRDIMNADAMHARLRKTLATTILLSALTTAHGQTATPTQNPYTSPTDVARGKRLFATNCAVCHGPAGAGGRGTNLARPNLPGIPDEAALFNVLHDGRPGTEMPPGWWVLNDHEIWQVAAFVRSLGRIEPGSPSGNAQAGREVFRTQECARCHQVQTEGGRMGPPLTDVGARRGASYLRTAILNPESALPEDFREVRLVTTDGKQLTGIWLNEDDYSIQIRDFSDHLLSFLKSELKSVENLPGKSPMPAYHLPDRELDDLVAYLVSLQGDR
jgi:putative heme-binding domain-containing protein